MVNENNSKVCLAACWKSTGAMPTLAVGMTPGKVIQMTGFGLINCGFLKVIGVHANIRCVAYDYNKIPISDPIDGTKDQKIGD